MLFHKVARKIVLSYNKNEEKTYLERLGHTDNGCKIEYPSIIGHGEKISLGEGTTILSHSRIQTYPDKFHNSNLKIGDRCFFCYRLSILAAAPVEIGNDVVFASDVAVISFNHGTDVDIDIPFMDQELVPAKIRIGNNVWVGEKATILSGVTIGNNVVIGAGSIVNKDIPDDCMAVGSPIRIIKKYNHSTHNWEKV